MSESLKDENNSRLGVSDLNKDLKDIGGLNSDELKKKTYLKLKVWMSQ